MENKASGRSFLPILLSFVLVSVIVLVAQAPLTESKTDYRVLLVGNGLLFLVTAVSYYLYSKGLRNNNIQIFLRVMYGSLLVKFFVCLVAVLIYGYVAQQAVNRNGVLGCFVLYMLYTFLEVRILLRLSKKNA
jgi:hypothetical protein